MKAKVKDPCGTVTYWEEGDRWLIKTQPHIALRLKRCFPKVDAGEQGVIQLSNTPENARDLEWFLQRYPHDCPYLHMLRTRAQTHRDQETLIAQLLNAPPNSDLREGFKMAEPPRDYQVQLAKMLKATRGLLCADDLGTGKSISAITAAADPELQPTLVVCFSHLRDQWRDFFRRFTPHLRVHILKQGTPYNFKDKWGNLPDVIICSYGMLRDWAQTLAVICKFVVWDEVQELRRDDSQKYEAAKVLADRVPWLLGLSHTPIYNYGIEMFNVMRCIKPDALGNRDEFVTEWCSGQLIKEPRSFGEYLRRTGLMVRRTRADIKRELPLCQSIVHPIECDEKSLNAGLTDCDALANIIVSRGEQFRGQKMQAASEFDMRMRQATGIAKAPYVAEFVRMLIESGEKVVLYGWHRAVYAIWQERLKDLKPVLYTGTETPAHKRMNKDMFVDGSANPLIISLRAGAGLDGLQKVSKTVVFGELDWSSGVHDQCVGRVDRDGQEFPVMAYYLVCDYGSDPIVLDVNGVKRQQAEGIRNPSADLVEMNQLDPNHVRKLAEAYLRRKHA